jgi:hypothetical protein
MDILGIVNRCVIASIDGYILPDPMTYYSQIQKICLHVIPSRLRTNPRASLPIPAFPRPSPQSGLLPTVGNIQVHGQFKCLLSDGVFYSILGVFDLFKNKNSAA